ncbi:hypothetical protein [Chitinophaga nivalis]|uniref:Uncharacterized protein n=1 Tax=Chitinophaga nivalis TaxID=2991709 RepID=A0ABT3INK6_9BACT|nr:hypothetical protein [Chitinophaga nivalis]MCW3464740.1 hypothetical protein [Chitinophaga nivalis]MCW3485569.1 hypothetical protein [Chitinophaga nivalis]
MSLSIVPLKQPDSLLTTVFDYYSLPVETNVTADGQIITTLKQKREITGYIVRQVILYALAAGWEPQVKRSVWRLSSVGDKIDLRLSDRS